MNGNEPSFYRMFRRSASYAPPDETDESVEAESLREERERFSGAAVAFCLKHSEQFRIHFWSQICKTSGDPDSISIASAGIFLEPPHWADLRVIFDDGVTRSVWVIEIKAGAPLDPRQDPTSTDFVRPLWGYGDLFAAEEGPKKSRMRYIVLGAQEHLEAPFRGERFGIQVQVRSWEQMLHGRPTDSLTQDLVASLAQMGIESFVMEEAKTIRVEGGLSQVGRAWKVLEGVSAWLGVKRDKYSLEAYEADNGGSALGVYIRAPGQRKPSDRHRRLATVSGSPDTLAWFGYFNSSGDEVRKELWLYFASEEARKQTTGKLGQLFAEERDGPAFCAVFKSVANDLGKDFDWFTSVFKSVVS